MPPKKVKKNNQQSSGEQDGQLSTEQRDQKRKLFMQQFEKEAQERIREMEAKMEQTLATLERVFRVELMKIPPAIRNTLIKDLLKEDDVPVGEVTIAMKVGLVASTTKRTQTHVAKVNKQMTASASQAGFESPISLSSLGAHPWLIPTSLTVCFRSTSSAGLRSLDTLFLTDDLKDHIDVTMLDDAAILQIEQLRKLMDYLCKKVRQNQ
uniref:Cell division cycle associated 9 n=1 Tax=Scleropages formosus TaxID=113540 RepID=A0A8C9S0J4_SCLFO